MDEFLRKRIISDKTPLPVLPALLKQWRTLINPGTEIQLVAEFLAEIQVGISSILSSLVYYALLQMHLSSFPCALFSLFFPFISNPNPLPIYISSSPFPLHIPPSTSSIFLPPSSLFFFLHLLFLPLPSFSSSMFLILHVSHPPFSESIFLILHLPNPLSSYPPSSSSSIFLLHLHLLPPSSIILLPLNLFVADGINSVGDYNSSPGGCRLCVCLSPPFFHVSQLDNF